MHGGTLRGVYMRKLAWARVSYRDDFWFRNAFTWWWVISYLGYLKVHFTLIKYTCDSKWQTLHIYALPVPVHRQTDFTPKRVVVSHLHDSVARFRTGVKFSLDPVQQSGWTHAEVNRTRMTFCGGIMLRNVEPWEETVVNSPRRESRPGVM